jgi:hypothetical protein
MVERLRIAALVFVIAIVMFLALAPPTLLDVVNNLMALWAFGLLVAAVGTLVWFARSFFLRRILRARRIANARMNRLLREKFEQDRE